MRQYKGHEYAEDCIHLKACRRLSKIATDKGKSFPRGCNENCSAYFRGNIQDIEKLQDIMRQGNNNGYTLDCLPSESFAKAESLLDCAIHLVEQITDEKWEFGYLTLF